MYPHRKPFSHAFDVDTEIGHLRSHLQQPSRRIPAQTDQNVLVATWNLTNFGEQKRTKGCVRLMAEVLRPFDVVAVQEVAEDLTQFWRLLEELGGSWDYLYTDVAGNQERLAYLFNVDRVIPLGLTGELAMRGYERQRIVLDEIVEEDGSTDFSGFNRNPFMVNFLAGGFEFTLINVHLYWSSMNLRILETKALGKWAKKRSGSKFPPHNDIILLGDFNMPESRPGDHIYEAVKGFGIRVPDHETNLVGTNLAGENDYDQIMFFPGNTSADFTGRMGVVDFDNAFFRGLWEQKVAAGKKQDFFKFIRWAIADHRPMWAEFKR